MHRQRPQQCGRAQPTQPHAPLTWDSGSHENDTALSLRLRGALIVACIVCKPKREWKEVGLQRTCEHFWWWVVQEQGCMSEQDPENDWWEKVSSLRRFFCLFWGRTKHSVGFLFFEGGLGENAQGREVVISWKDSIWQIGQACLCAHGCIAYSDYRSPAWL